MPDPRDAQDGGEAPDASPADAPVAEAPPRLARPRRPAVAPWITASLADLAGLVLIVAVQEVWTLFAAAGLHVAALLPIALMRALSPSARVLAIVDSS